MITAQDRLFLREYASFVCLSHPVAAIAFRNAAVSSDKVASLAEARARRLNADAAEEVASRGNTSALVQTYVVARLLGELAGAVEDLGALLDAVRYRDRRGILQRYLASEAGQVSSAWDLVLTGTRVPDLLNFPPSNTQGLGTESDQGPEYVELGRVLRDIAHLYRTRTAALPVRYGSGSETLDEVNILTGIAKIGTPASGATLKDAYNKIKHRFAVVENISGLGDALAETGLRAEYVRYPREPSKADILYNNVFTVAATGGEVAAIVLHLDGLGMLATGV